MLSKLFGHFSPHLNYRYHIDRVTSAGIEGWVYNKHHRKPCTVQILTLDRKLIAEGTTDLLRNDLDGRVCGFRLGGITRKLQELTPGRAMLVVDGIKLSTLHFFAPVDTSIIEQELLERHELLGGLKAARLEQENEQLTRRVAELELLLAEHENVCT